MSTESSDFGNSLTLLLQKASNTTAEGITISDMRLPDQPLIYLNEGFEKLTGYDRNDVIGKNCRFLQGEQTNKEAVEEIRRALKDGRECMVELMNYRKDGTPFWNRLSLTPLRNEQNKVTHYVGIQSDITELKETKERLQAANKSLEEFRKKIVKELEQARVAQEFIFPKKLPDSEKVQFFSKFTPMAEIGGDFFDVFELSKGVYGMLIADVTGHGIPAALLTFMSSAAFKNSTVENISPAETIRSTNSKLFQKMPDTSFVSMLYAVYDSNRNILTYSQAGHPDGLLIRPGSREVIRLSTEGTLVGIFSPEDIEFGEKELQLEVGDKVIFYTDAIIEMEDSGRNMLGIDGLADFLNQNADISIKEMVEKVYQFGLTFGGETEYGDDFTMVGFEVIGD